MKRHMHVVLLAAAGMWAILFTSTVNAQTPSPPPPAKSQPNPQQPGPQQPKNAPTVAVAFRNDLKTAIIVQGHTVVGGMQRRGQPIYINVDKVSFDNNVPAGVRYITVFDATQPSRVLLLNVPILVQSGRDVAVIIRVAPNNPNRIVIVPAEAGK